MRISPGDIIIACGLFLTGVGIHIVRPAWTGYFLLILGILLCTLWAVVIVRGKAK